MSLIPSSAGSETSTEHLSDRTWLQGTILSAVAYGVQLNLFVMCFIVLYRQCRSKCDRKAVFFLLYVILGFILGTLILTTTASTAQLSYVDGRYYPLGPALFEVVGPLTPMREIGYVSSIAAGLLADALLVWRCIVFYKGCGLSLWAVSLFPCLLYGGTSAMAVIFLIRISFTLSSAWASITAHYTISYWSLSLSLNVLTTVAIVIRLLLYRRRIIRALGSQHGKQYISIAAMMIESSSLFSIMSLLYLVTYVLKHPTQYVFGQILSQVQIIAPLMIILRVAEGKAWSVGVANDVLSSNALAQSGSLAEMGGMRTVPSVLFSSRARAPETITIPREALDNRNPSPMDSVKDVIN